MKSFVYRPRQCVAECEYKPEVDIIVQRLVTSTKGVTHRNKKNSIITLQLCAFCSTAAIKVRDGFVIEVMKTGICMLTVKNDEQTVSASLMACM